ncbi:hypothetical protein [Rhizosphaericola mali]|uniref:HPP family protein n=1 Tax=Rhizosphaericola mali TaxID=2545455 RepID=A0A5P2G274_9BACT|nr:hypothetical protein [Rhizosphaericola mali]QES89277.1 hypothetical protein E0W69_011590 [Rhizosphaericola mali]
MKIRIRPLGSYINFSILPALILVLVMLGVSMFFRSDEIILPELSALSVGCFVYKIPHWTSKPLALFYIPSGTAVIGFVINMFTLPIYIKLILVLVAMIAFLQIIRNNLAPALATGLLPVITDCRSFYFIGSILVFTFLLFLIVKFFYQNGEKEFEEKKGKNTLILPYVILLIVWIVICKIINIPAMFAIPPVIVVGFEYVQNPSYNISMSIRHIIALAIAAFIGTWGIFYLHDFILVGIVDFIVVTLTLKFLNTKLPPAYAMAILPMVIGEHLNWLFPIYVLVMSIVHFAVVIFIKKKQLNKQLIKTKA